MLFLVVMLLLLLFLLPFSSIIVVRKTILFVSRMHKISVTYIFCVTSVDDPNIHFWMEDYVIACFL